MRYIEMETIVERAECYFKDELVVWKEQNKSIWLHFINREYAEQFIKENEKIKELQCVKFELQPSGIHVVARVEL